MKGNRQGSLSRSIKEISELFQKVRKSLQAVEKDFSTAFAQPVPGWAFLLQIDGGVHAVDVALIQLLPQQLDGFAGTVNVKYF